MKMEYFLMKEPFVTVVLGQEVFLSTDMSKVAFVSNAMAPDSNSLLNRQYHINKPIKSQNNPFTHFIIHSFTDHLFTKSQITK